MIRLATADDAVQIAGIWNPIIRDSVYTFNSVEKSPADIAALIAERTRDRFVFFVSEMAGEILGFASYSQFRGGIGYKKTMEHTVMISQNSKGAGIGRKLLQAIEVHAKNAGHHSMFAGITGGNSVAIEFHARLGYEQVARIPDAGYKFEQFFDLVLMQKHL